MGCFSGINIAGELAEVSARYKPVYDGDVEDFFNYDLRRPWVVDRLKEQGPWW